MWSLSVFAAQEDEAQGYGGENERRGTKVEKAGEMAGTATRQEQLPVFSCHPGCLALFGSRGAHVAGTCRYRLALPIMPSETWQVPLQLLRKYSTWIFTEVNIDSIAVDVRRDDTKATATRTVSY